MNKHFIVIFGLLAIAFLAITVIKYLPEDQPPPSQSTDLDEQHTNQDARVVDFWKYYNSATDLRNRGQYQEAINFYRMALNLDSTHKNALYYLGNMQLANRKFLEAQDSWNKLTEIHSQSARGHLQLGNLYSCKTENNSLYDLKMAANRFQAAARLNAEETGPRLQLAKIHIINQDYDLAGQMLSDVVSSNFRSVEAFFLNGYLQWLEKDIDGAVKQLNRAIALSSKSGEGSSNVGEGETKAGDSPMFTDSFRCSLFSDYINQQLQSIHKDEVTVETVYQQFQSELLRYQN